MVVERLHHFNIRCAPADLVAIERFYTTVAGLKRGHRPTSLRNDGIWMYLGDQPIIHVTANCALGDIEIEHRGSVDHIALQSRGAAGFLARLERLGIPSKRYTGNGFQVFVTDPVGTRIEFNFPDNEAPAG